MSLIRWGSPRPPSYNCNPLTSAATFPCLPVSRINCILFFFSKKCVMYFTQFSSYHHNHVSCMRTVIFVRLPLRPQHLECGLAHGCRIMHFRMNGNCFVIMNLPAECPRCPSMLTYCNRIKTVGTIQSSGLVMSSGTFFRLALRKKKKNPHYG